MSKRHYDMIARVLREAKGITADPEEMRGWIINRFAELLKEDNDRFNVLTFMTACNVGKLK